MGEECHRREAIALTRINIVVEGQTEETFVRDVLAPELGERNKALVARAVFTGRRKGRTFRGGLTTYEKLQQDLIRWMKEDSGAWYTTMVDFYRLPNDFPGYQACIGDTLERVRCLEGYFRRDIQQMLFDMPVASRFVPHLQVHEFEALLFSEPQKFANAFPDEPSAIERLAAIRQQHTDPEAIDDGPETAPSKRIKVVLPSFSKTVQGILVAKSIGLPRMRLECPHFHSWIETLESL